MNMEDYRQPEYPVNSFFVERWSPRAFSGETLRDDEIMSLFEAARWAPSSYNAQPWRFLYAKKETEAWRLFFDLLVDFNKQWAVHAAVLIVFISRKIFEKTGEPAPTHSFDTGAAWENLALQASLKGLAAHGMQGFDYEKARKVLEIPDDYQVEAMAAVGKPGRKEDLPENMREREIPSGRKPVKELVMEGKFRH